VKHQSRPSALLNWLCVDRRSEAPLYRQVAEQIRNALLAGRIGPGELLPASRALALDLGVSRITTLQAYDQLIAEGFLETQRGSGTRAASSLAKKPLTQLKHSYKPFASRHLQDLFHEPPCVEFQPGIPAFDAFPRLRWSRLLQRHAARNDPSLLDYAHVGGYAPLRQELAKYLNGSRGVACHPQQIIVVTSTRAAVSAVCSVLWRPETTLAVEDPGYQVVQRVLIAAGHPLRHVPVDSHGMQVDDLLTASEPCAGAYITPAHQWPTGRTLSAERRITLLDWAIRTGAWIIEDDYDSEFRFDSPPVATLHSLGSGRVIYIGTFSKTLAPSIRTAYLVVPSEAVGDFEREVFQQGIEPSLHVQAALSDFLAEGDFPRHIARMRRLYAQRRDLLFQSLRQAFDDRLSVLRPPGGLQLIAILPQGVPDVDVSQRAAKAGIVARPLSDWYVNRPAQNALQLGFAAVPEVKIQPGVARLHAAISDLFAKAVMTDRTRLALGERSGVSQGSQRQ
jgi:GntR family transcriptional regulator/MocR family aminotransferase